MEEDVTKTVIMTLKAYLHEELPPDKDFFHELDSRGFLASTTARELAQLADQGKQDCVWKLVTYMEQFYTEENLLRLCAFLKEYAQPARPRLATIASRIRQEISKQSTPHSKPTHEGEDEDLSTPNSEKGKVPLSSPEAVQKGGRGEDGPSSSQSITNVAVVKSVLDLMPYFMDMTAHLFELAAVLGVEKLARALINGHGTPQDKCLQILSHWLDSTPKPTWALLCQKLRLVSSFNAVVHKIARDHNLPTAEPRKEQDKELPHASNSWEEQYKKVIEKQCVVKVKITRCVLIGPARVGKSSLKQLLVHNEPRPVHKSTDLMEAPVVLASMYHQRVIARDTNRERSSWTFLTVDNLKQMLKKSTAEGDYNLPSDATVQESHQDSRSSQASGTDHPSELPSSVPTKDDDDFLSDLKSQFSRFVEGLKSVGDTKLIMNGLQLIHLFDCGGQLAFQDAIPCLIHAPCAFIAVFDASVDLEEVKEWTYCPHEGSKEVGRGHRESQWNILSGIFSSIHSLQYKCQEDLKILTQDKLSSSWPIAVVGTHKAVLNQHTDFSTINKSISSHFEKLLKSKPYYDSFLQPVPLDLIENCKTPKDDLRRIDELREQISEKASFSLDLPLTWLFLELFTRSHPKKLLFIRYKDLKKLCNDDSITNGDDEFKLLLRVLHALGFYAYYPLKDLGVPDDQNWVCTDAATLYKEVSKLLMVQYTVVKPPKTKAAKYLKDFGKIELNDDSDLQNLFKELKINTVFSPKWLILVLVYIGLAAKYKPRGGKEQVFIPLALPFKGFDLPPVTELSVATLFLTLEFLSSRSTGSVNRILTDMPCGIFPRLVVRLLSEELKCSFRTSPDSEDSDSACVTLMPSESECDYRLYLKNSINWVEVALQVNETAVMEHHEPAKKVYEICKEIRDTLTSSLDYAFLKLFGKQPPEKAVTARCGFKCTCKKSSETDHLRVAVNMKRDPPIFTCVLKQRDYRLQPRSFSLSQRIWFCPLEAEGRTKFSPLQDGSDILVMDDPSSSALEIKPKEKELRKIADNCGHEWKALLTNVGVLSAQIQQFQVNAATTQDACFAGLVSWRLGNTEEPATWSILLEAMEEAKMAAYAREWKKKIIDSCSGQSGSGKPGNGQPPTPAKEVPSDVPKLTNIKDFMEHFKDKFLEDVAVEDVMVDRFKNNNVIPEQVYSRVMKEDTSYGKRSKIWNQVRSQGLYDTVERLCKAMIAAENSPKTIKLGKKMEAALIANKAVILKNEE